MIGKIYYGNTLVSNPVEGNIEITSNGTYDVGSYENAIINVDTNGNDKAQFNDVNFYDYDGTLLYSYSKSEFATLTALPANPSHSGLTAQGWNWSLANAKTYVSTYNYLNIGQMYITSDGKTRFYFQNASQAQIRYVKRSGSTNVSIDWGDGTSTSSYASGTNHTYSTVGDYVVTITVPSGVTIMLGSSSDSYNVVGSSAFSNPNNGTLSKVEVGERVVGFGTRCFERCTCLQTITTSTSITAIGCKFDYDKSLKIIIVPNTTTLIGMDNSGSGYDCSHINCVSLRTIVFSETKPTVCNLDLATEFNGCIQLESITFNNKESLGASGTSGFFTDCRALKHVSFGPMNVSNSLITGRFFYNCYSLSAVVISEITTITGPLFAGCPALKKIVMVGNYPPTLNNALVTSSSTPSSSDFKIYVPSGYKSRFTSATNWSDIPASRYIEY